MIKSRALKSLNKIQKKKIDPGVVLNRLVWSGISFGIPISRSSGQSDKTLRTNKTHITA